MSTAWHMDQNLNKFKFEHKDQGAVYCRKAYTLYSGVFLGEEKLIAQPTTRASQQFEMFFMKAIKRHPKHMSPA